MEISPDNNKTLLFVSGFPSGGTDLMKTICNAHPDIFLNGEMPLLAKLSDYGYNNSTLIKNESDILRLESILSQLDTWNNIKELHQAKEILFDELEKKLTPLTVSEALTKLFSDKNTRVWGNKTPQYTENISALSDIFPDAFWIIVTRDPRDICLSWKKKWGKNMVFCASKWASRMKNGYEETLSKPEFCLFVKYEDLLLKTEETCKTICRFLSIPFSKRMLEHYKYTDDNPGKINYGKPIVSRNINKWAEQLPAQLIKRIEEVAYETMVLFGYTPEFASSPKGIKSYEKYKGFLHDTLAMVFIGNKADPQNTIVKRVKNVKRVLQAKFK